MKVPYSWLGEFVELTHEPEKIAELLTSAGMKVEKIRRLGEGVEGVVSARVTSIEPHPKADRLQLVDVDVGATQHRVVCGAFNFKVNDVVPFASPGARLPEFGLLEARSIRGIVSEGMLCSSRELGLGDDHSGILILPEETPPGEDVRDVLALNDLVFELEITPNRPDALSLLGIAREVAACTGAQLKDFAPNFQASGDTGLAVSVEILDETRCPRYLATVFGGVEVKDSPPWVKRRLELAGMRPISNVVDATNYALWVTGHPMHAFDLDLLADQRLTVRTARVGEELVSIDQQKLQLDTDDLVIADATRPVALAGVMGGADSAVHPGTTNVVLESAYFEPASIFRSSKRHSLRTESSVRFERGADPNGVADAAAYAASLLLEWAGGRARPAVDLYSKPILPRPVQLRPERARLVLGLDVEAQAMVDALNRLELNANLDNGVIATLVPTRRPDLAIEEDLIEEVARVVGFEQIPSKLPGGSNRAGKVPATMRLIRRLRSALAGAGLFEAKTSILVSPAAASVGALAIEPGKRAPEPLIVENPLSEQESVLRNSLLPGLLNSMKTNVSRRATDVRLFEVGNVFFYDTAGRFEPLRLGMALGGVAQREWHSPERTLDLFDLKGAIETLADSLGIDGLRFISGPTGRAFHSGKSGDLRIGDNKIGEFGELGPEIQEELDPPFQIYIAEIDVERLLAGVTIPAAVEDRARFPEVLMDLAVVVPEDVPSSEILETATAAAGEHLEAIRLIDVYRGDQVREGHKSLAFAISFRRPDRTLKEDEGARALGAIAQSIEKRHSGKVRGLEKEQKQSTKGPA